MVACEEFPFMSFYKFYNFLFRLHSGLAETDKFSKELLPQIRGFLKIEQHDSVS